MLRSSCSSPAALLCGTRTGTCTNAQSQMCKRAMGKKNAKEKESAVAFWAGAPRGAVQRNSRSSEISPSLMKATGAVQK